MKVTARIFGAETLGARLGAAARSKRVDEVMHKAALEVERRAKHLAPRDGSRPPVVDRPVSGRLRASITESRVRAGEYQVAARVPYAKFQEFGTGLRGRASPQPMGVPGGYSHGMKIGIIARPFLRPPLVDVRRILQNPKTWEDLL